MAALTTFCFLLAIALILMSFQVDSQGKTIEHLKREVEGSLRRLDRLEMRVDHLEERARL